MSALTHTQEGELTTAFHEAGHAVIGAALGRVVEGVNIIPTDRYYGMTSYATDDGITDRVSNGPETLTWPVRPDEPTLELLRICTTAAGPVAHHHYHPTIPDYPECGWELFNAQQEGDCFGLYGNSLVELLEDLLDHHGHEVRRIAELLLTKKEISGDDVGVSRCPTCCAVVESVVVAADLTDWSAA